MIGTHPYQVRLMSTIVRYNDNVECGSCNMNKIGTTHFQVDLVPLTVGDNEDTPYVTLSLGKARR